MFKVSYQLFVNQSSHFTLFEDHEMLKNISVIGYIAAIAAMVYPLLSGREWEKKYFALAIIWPLINLAWLFIMIVMVKNEINNGDYAELFGTIKVKVEFAASAWILIIASISTAIASAMVSQSLIEEEEYALQVEEKKAFT